MNKENDSFLKILSIEENTELDEAEAQLREHINECLYPTAPENKNLPLNHDIEKLEKYMNEFFDFSKIWLRGRYQGGESDGSTKAAAELKRKGFGVMDTLQTEMTKFVVNFLKLERFISSVREQLRRKEDTDQHSIDIDWSVSIAMFIERSRKTYEKIIYIISDHKKVYDLLKEREENNTGMEEFESRVRGLLGAKKATPIMRSLSSDLRACEFVKARKRLKEIEQAAPVFSQQKTRDTVALGENLIDFFDTNEAFLRDRVNDRLFLKYREIKLLYETQKYELEKAYKYIRKYHLPFLKYNLDSLLRIRKKIMIIGSHEQLLILHRKLMKGLASPLTKIQHERIFESEVINPINYLVDYKFAEGPRLLKKAEESVRIFHKALEEGRIIEQLDAEKPEELIE